MKRREFLKDLPATIPVTAYTSVIFDQKFFGPGILTTGF